MEKDLPLIYVPKISCFIVLFLPKINNNIIIQFYIYISVKVGILTYIKQHNNPKPATHKLSLSSKKSNPLLPYVLLHYKKG